MRRGAPVADGWLARVTAALLVVSIGVAAVPLAELSAAGVPLALTLLLTALTAVVARSIAGVRSPSLGLALATTSIVTREGTRQSDPDAAGHIRPRAPGSRAGRHGH